MFDRSNYPPHFPNLGAVLSVGILVALGAQWASAQQRSVASLRDLIEAGEAIRLEKWYETPPSRPLSTWTNLIRYDPTKEAKDLLRVHIEDPMVQIDRLDENGGAVNLDYYAVRVQQMPKKKNGQNYKAEELLAVMRSLLSDVKLPGDRVAAIRRTLVQFQPAMKSTTEDWAEAKRGTLMKLGFGNIDLQLWRVDRYCKLLEPVSLDSVCQAIDRGLQEFAGDQGYIMISESVATNFRVVTVRDREAYPFSTAIGTHPVAGFREFGFSKRQGAAGYTFYVMGADQMNRLHGLPDELHPTAEHVTFAGGAAHWRLFISEFVRFVEEHEGTLAGEPVLDRGTVSVQKLKEKRLWP